MAVRPPLGSAALWNAAGWGAGAVQGLVVAALLVRSAGVPAFGIWATVVAWRAFLLVGEGGIGAGIARDVALAAGGDAQAGARARAGVRVSLAWGVLAALAMCGAGVLTKITLGLAGADAGAAAAVARLLAVETGLMLVAAPFLAVARGHGRFDVGGAAAVLQLAALLAGAASLGRAPGLVDVATLTCSARGLATVATVLAVLVLRLLPAGAPRAAGAWRQLVAYAAPLWLTGLAFQVSTASDVPIVGVFFGVDAASAYALGSKLPLAGLGLLGALTAAALPRLVESRGEGRIAVAALCALAATLGVLGFLGLALHARSLLTVWVGDAPPLAVQVTVLHSFAWLLNVPAHVLSLAAIAQGRHGTMALVVAGESVANLVLTVALAGAGFPAGPAWATLATLFVSNVVILPPLLLRQLGLPARTVLRPLLFGALVGGAGAAVTALATAAAGGGAARQVTVFVVATLAFAGAALDLTLRKRSALRWLWRMLALGGARVRWCEWRERRQARAVLARARAAAPLVWFPHAPPLVTVRIATYNRGRVVAERAIASALRQTHQNLEVLVVGDCCDEATERAVRGVRDPRVRFVNLPERGRYPADARRRWMVAGAAPMNHALQLMRGEWVAPLDDDDEFTDDHVEVLLEACRVRDLEFAYGKSSSERADGTWREVGAWPPGHGSIVHAAVLYSARLRGFLHSFESWRVDEPGDWNLWRRMQRAGVRMGFVDRVVCRHYAEAREVKHKPPVWLGEPVGV